MQVIYRSLGLCLGSISSVVYSATEIEKCQDKKGIWYYGQSAAQACGQGSIKTLNESGVVIRERVLEAPTPSAKVMSSKHVVQQNEDVNLLRQYSNAERINSERLRKMGTIEKLSSVSKKMLGFIEGDLDSLYARPKTDKTVRYIETREAAKESYLEETNHYQREIDTINRHYDDLIARYNAAKKRTK